MKAFAMKCPVHHVEYETVKTTYEQYGVILRDAKALRCPVDGEELFALEQAELGPRLKLIRKITRAACNPEGNTSGTTLLRAVLTCRLAGNAYS